LSIGRRAETHLSTYRRVFSSAFHTVCVTPSIGEKKRETSTYRLLPRGVVLFEQHHTFIIII
jgi:hypothetical protein